ncbi:MAG: hypothetical protein M3Y55_08780 [Pseudomonadota bacterium]|nr:hypothetical protein [Pseudomonadota bacterium]
MKQRFALVVLVLSSAFLGGCASVPPSKSEASYPSRLEGFGRYDRFPATVAGYHRGVVTAYAPELANYSVAYDRHDAELQNAVTLYFYPRPRGNQLEAEQAEVRQAHPGASVRSSNEVTLQGRAGVYNASLTTFEYEEVFAGRPQRVSSQLLLVFLPAQTFKVRSTAPLEQARAAEAAMLRVVDGISWAPEP